MSQSTTENKEAEQASSPHPADATAKIYQSVALSAAIAVQDAADNLRNINTICTSATAVAMAQMVEEPASAERMQEIITMIQSIISNAAENYSKINENAAKLLSVFPQ